ncbi:MAG: cell wall-binding repeat-containing protein [Actinobacteria bacterium]|nr:cell wall-binding repeat-containing protein [Actinomycetota bacterium]
MRAETTYGRRALLVALVALSLIVTALPAQALQVAQAEQVPPVDPYAPAEPQAVCDPTPKPGVVGFAKLLLEAYPVSGWSGISRDCGVRGGSEHKEGRAFDWAVSVSNPQQKAAADDALATLLAPDEDGTPHALFRRFGLMYIIWNRQIFSAAQPEAGWRPYGCDPAASYDSCHVNHVHFSFSSAGAQMQTSWWSLAPEPAPPATLVERIAGLTPVDTAIDISQRAFPTPGAAARIYLAHAETAHEAMTAAVMAGASHGAVLLTAGGDELEATVDAEIRRLLGDQPEATITVVGGQDALPDTLVEPYRDRYVVDRITGDDRYASARAAARAMERAGQQRTAVLVGADALDEALPMIAVAAANDWPVLFTDRDDLHDDTRGFLVEAGVTSVHLAGSTDAIGRAVREQIAELDDVTVRRHGGEDAAKISVTVAERFFAIPSAYAVAQHDDTPTAAVAAAYAGERRHAPLLVTDGATLTDPVTAYVADTSSPDASGLVFGDRDTVHREVERQLRRVLRR